METLQLPTTIHINNDTDITDQGYLVLKLTAIAKLKELTKKGKQTIDNATTTSTSTALQDLETDYESILTEWDKTEAEFDLKTHMAITSIQNALEKSS